MYVILLSCVALFLQILPPVASSPYIIIREEGEDVVFLFNTSTAILEVSWGMTDGDTRNLKLGLIAAKNINGEIKKYSSSNPAYAGRVSFVGDLSKGQAWFKITDLNINDTNMYMAKIYAQGGTPGKYNYSYTKLVVTKQATTAPLPITTTGSTSAVSASSQTFPLPTQAPQISNRSISIKVVKEDSADFTDSNSILSKNFSKKIVSEINSVYKNIDDFVETKVISLSENSIPVKFVVFFKSKIKPEEICAPLKDEIKHNKLGSLKIVPGSLGCLNDPSTSFPKNQSSTGSSCTLIIAVCVTINIFLVLVVVVLLIYIWRLRLNTAGKRAESRSSSTKDKDLEVYENAQLEDTTEAITRQTSNAEKELYETINENRDQRTAAIPANLQSARSPSVGARGDVPQHYQELQRKAPNPTPLYEPLNKRDFGNKERLTSEGQKTYELLQQSTPGREYQSLKHYKETESKV